MAGLDPVRTVPDVDGSLEVHAEHDDTVPLAGHMRESWNDGTVVVALEYSVSIMIYFSI